MPHSPASRNLDDPLCEPEVTDESRPTCEPKSIAEASHGANAPAAHLVQVGLDVPLPRLFDYLLPEPLQACVGSWVLVPFGNRKCLGVVLGFPASSEVAPVRLRAVAEVLSDRAPLDAAFLELARFCASYYQFPLGAALMAALPAALRNVRMRKLQPNGLVWTLTQAGRDASIKSSGQRQLRAQALASGTLTRQQILAISPRGIAIVDRMVEQGWLTTERSSAAGILIDGPQINADQALAVSSVQAAVGFHVFLLHGITGSGKTEVYLQLMAQHIAAGGQVLLLVPEINLTPQLESRLRERLPRAHIVTLHSDLAEDERARNWLAAAQGHADIVLGTRLAVFAPMPRLQLTIVDEEHDPSFKQQEALRYSARDVAIYRARQGQHPILLGSATPALETYRNAQIGRYSLLSLPARANPAARIPSVHCIDLNVEVLDQGLAPSAWEALKACLARREQALVFLNRRGYAPVLTCPSCGYTAGCHRCSSKLVWHRADRLLRCHYCGDAITVPQRCPTCGNQDLQAFGRGTQRLEISLAERFPAARVTRIDRDSVKTKRAFEAAMDAVHAGSADILVGTQMLSKGHDFARMTLVIVVGADAALLAPDYRATERLYAGLMQVAGRAGRADLAGEVLIQTRYPDHPLYRAVQRHDYCAFAQSLLAERRAAGFPPFVQQAVLRADAEKLAHALEFLRHAKDSARQWIDDQLTVYDPVPLTMTRVAGRERAQLLIQAHNRRRLQEFLGRWAEHLYAIETRAVRWHLEVDPFDV